MNFSGFTGLIGDAMNLFKRFTPKAPIGNFNQPFMNYPNQPQMNNQNMGYPNQPQMNMGNNRQPNSYYPNQQINFQNQSLNSFNYRDTHQYYKDRIKSFLFREF